jgi:DNA-binding NarL/FixJ family response regulator
VARGGSYLSSQVSDRLLARIQAGDLRTVSTQAPLDTLSPRELQVLRLVAEGKTSKDIAVLLDLGLQTVRGYRKMLMKKLGVNNVAGVTQMALAAGLMHWDKPNGNSLG